MSRHRFLSPRQLARAGVSVVLLSAVASSASAVPTPPDRSAITGVYPDSVTITGHGFGHGDGLSQWGAYGYAVERGWDWAQILDHYYGGTTRDTVANDSEMTVQILAMDDATATSVVHATASLATNADPTPANRYTAIVAVETADRTYRVYGRSDQPVCAVAPVVADLDNPTSGWRVVNPAFVSTSTATRLVVSAPDLATASTANPADLVSLCMPDGTLRSYRGAIQIVNGTAGENRTVSALPLDAYVRSVVPSESIPSWGDSAGGKGANALRAQAVAARTYSLASKRATYAQTCDTGQCQVYPGMARRSSLSSQYAVQEDPRTDAAVAATAGVILRNAAGKPAFAQFSSSSGGYTAGINFPAVEDLGDAVAANPGHNWTTTVTRANIEKAFNVGTLQGIEVLTRNGLGDFGGRVKTMRLRGTTGSVTVTGEQFRGALGLKSAWFALPTGCDGSPLGSARQASASRYHVVAPTRIVDTRSGIGALRSPGACTIVVPIAGRAGVPTTATSVTVNVTVVGGSSAGYATLFPCDQGRPASSNVNVRPSIAVANLATVGIDGAGDICVFVDTSADVIVDVLGWEGPGPGSTLAVNAPRRIADTREGARLAANSVLTVSIPADLRSSGNAVLNVTATGSIGSGFVTVHPCDGAQPGTSNLNFVAGRDVANQVTTALSSTATVCLFASQSTHLVVDAIGGLTDVAGSGGSLVVSAPTRVFDSRQSTKVGPGAVARVTIPASSPPASAVMVNVTGTETAAAGFVTVYDCEKPQPGTSNLNLSAGVDVANVATVPIGVSREICLSSSATTHLVIDLLGRLVP
jgi:SpoIID/LytB domain protein